MLEIASEIIICLLLAALIGFALGYLVAKRQSEKSESATNEQVKAETNNSAEKSTPTAKEKVETESNDTVKKEETEVESQPVEEQAKEETADAPEDIEIPTDNAIEEALEAMEALEHIEKEPETPADRSEAGQKPELLSAARNGQKDTLSNIKGIGPKLEEKLNAAGIYHFDQIANWSEENMIWLEENTLFTSRAKNEAWIAASKALLS